MKAPRPGPTYWWIAAGPQPASGTLWGPGPYAGTYWMTYKGGAYEAPLRAAQLYESERECLAAIKYQEGARPGTTTRHRAMPI